MTKGFFLLGGKKKSKKRQNKKKKRKQNSRKKIGMRSLRNTVLRSEQLFEKFSTLIQNGDYEGFKNLTLNLPSNISLNDIYLIDNYGIKTFLHNEENPFNDPYGRSLIFIAVEQQDTLFLRKLLESHFKNEVINYAYQYKVDDKILSGLDPLILASYYGDAKIVDLLLSKMVMRNINDSETQTMNPIQRPSKGWTPLIAAVEGGHIEVAKLLLKRGVDVNKTSKDIKFTPLHYAVHNGDLDMVKLLIKHNADLNKQTTVFKETPLHIAMKKDYKDIIEVLLRSGSKTTIPDLYNRTYSN